MRTHGRAQARVLNTANSGEPTAGKKFIFEKAKELGVRTVVIDGPDSWSQVCGGWAAGDARMMGLTLPAGGESLVAASQKLGA